MSLGSAGCPDRETGEELVLVFRIPACLGNFGVPIQPGLELGHELDHGSLFLGGVGDLLLGPGLVVGRLRVQELR
jgi:hypothetical protein